MTVRTIPTESAVPQTGQPGGSDGYVGQKAGKNQIKNCSLRVHHTAWQTTDWAAVIRIRDQKHRAGKNGSAVGHDIRSALPDRQRRFIIGATLMPPVQNTISRPASNIFLTAAVI